MHGDSEILFCLAELVLIYIYFDYGDEDETEGW